MQDPRRRFEEVEAFYAMLSEVHAKTPGVYIEQWLTYLSHYDLPMVRLWGLDELREIHACLPSNTPVSFHFPHLAPSDDIEELCDLLANIWLRHVRIPDLSDEHIERLVSSECLLCTEALTFDTRIISARSLDRLLDGASILELETLVLRGVELGREWLERLADAPGLEHLQRLEMSLEKTHSDAMASFFTTSRLESLRHFNITLGHRHQEALDHLAEATWLPQLESLNLNENHLDDNLLLAIASVPDKRLRTLRFAYRFASQSPVSTEAIGAFCDSPHHKDLRLLGLSGHQFTNEVLDVLARAERLRSLEALDLSHNALTGEDITHRVSPERLPNLKCLRLDHNAITDMVFFSDLGSIETLDLAFNRIRPTQLATFSMSAAAINLTRLRLAHNPLENEIATVLGGAGAFGSLTMLDVSSTGLDDDAIEELATTALLDRIEVLLLAGNELTNASLDLLLSPRLANLRVLDLNANRVILDTALITRLQEGSHLEQFTHLGLAAKLFDNSPRPPREVYEQLEDQAREQGMTKLTTRYNRTIFYPWRDRFSRATFP